MAQIFQTCGKKTFSARVQLGSGQGKHPLATGVASRKAGKLPKTLAESLFDIE